MSRLLVAGLEVTGLNDEEPLWIEVLPDRGIHIVDRQFAHFGFKVGYELHVTTDERVGFQHGDQRTIFGSANLLLLEISVTAAFSSSS